MLHGFTNNIIKRREDNFSEDDLNKNFGNSKKRLAMLDLLISGKHKGLIDDAGIQEEVDTFTFEVLIS